jgi:predicted Zn-dependent protease
MRRIPIIGLFLALLLSLPGLAQTATEYSDKDKKKMAELGQKPEVQAEINRRWNTKRREDLDYAFIVNSSTRIAAQSPAAMLEFRTRYGQLYDNPILLRYVNSIGQRLVPRTSPNLYSFRLLLDPMPDARSLSTGTIYVTTGLVSMLDNEAQLAYVLSHEIAHVERKHHYNKIRNEVLEEEFAKWKEQDSQKKRSLFGALVGAAGAGLGAGLGGAEGAMFGALGGAMAGGLIGNALFKNRYEMTDWDKAVEDEADEAGMQIMLEQNYDAREIPRLYARLDKLVARDERAGLSFIGSPQRVRERTAQVQSLLTGNYRPALDAKMKAPGGLVGSGPEFNLLMASLKRDNGVAALDQDLFAIAKDNLEEASRLRSNDPRTYYYLGQVMVATGRTADEKQQAIKYFLKAIETDSARGAYPEPHLENALFMIAQSDPAQQDTIKSELKTYVALYQREHGGSVPPNMHIIYDYFRLAGDDSWYVPPASAVTTNNVEAFYVTPVQEPPPTDAHSVVQRALHGKAELKPASLPNNQN